MEKVEGGPKNFGIKPREIEPQDSEKGKGNGFHKNGVNAKVFAQNTETYEIEKTPPPGAVNVDGAIDLQNPDSDDNEIKAVMQVGDDGIATFFIETIANPNQQGDIELGASVTLKLSDKFEINFEIENIESESDGSITITGTSDDGSRVRLALENAFRDPSGTIEVTKPITSHSKLIIEASDVGGGDPTLEGEFKIDF